MAIVTKRRYEKKEEGQPPLVVLWDSDLCIHCGLCHEKLPEVFKPDERPWVQLEGASTSIIIDQVNQCPSQALSIEKEPTNA